MVNDRGQPKFGGGDVTPPPRDPEAAVREEFELARARNTPEALELFA